MSANLFHFHSLERTRRGGPGSGFWNSEADHHNVVYRVRSTWPGAKVEWLHYRFLFTTRAGSLPILPESGTREQLNDVEDQFTPGALVVDGTLYTITAEGTEETEKPTMPTSSHILLVNPWRIVTSLPDGYKGKHFEIQQREDLEKLSQSQLLDLFKLVLPAKRHKSYTFKNHGQAVEFVWNVWVLLLSQIGPRVRPTPEPVRGQVANVMPRKERGSERHALAGAKLTRTALGKGARRKEGTRRTDSWNVIEDGMTFEDFVAAGGHPDDLNIIIRLGHVTVGVS